MRGARDDVAAGIVAALERGTSGERDLLGGGENQTIRQLAELVLEVIGRRTAIVTVPNALVRVATRAVLSLHIPPPYKAHVVPYATRYRFVDSTKAQRELGLTFRDARETIEHTLRWLKETSAFREQSCRRLSAALLLRSGRPCALRGIVVDPIQSSGCGWKLRSNSRLCVLGFNCDGRALPDC